MMEPMDGIIDKVIDHIEEKAKTNPTLELKPIIEGFILDVIARCAFGLDTNAHR
jgi:hypothetical protein